MTDKNSGFVESEQVFGVYRNRLHCGNPKERYTVKEWTIGFSDIDSQWIESSYDSIYKYRPELGGWVFLGRGRVTDTYVSTEAVDYSNLGMIADAISIEEAKARFPEAFPMHEVER
jgi:hypothetical protein